MAAAQALGPASTIELVTSAGIRGRGGAGFLTGAKWASVRSGGAGARYVVANGAEGEPASFKDRMLIRRDPYRIVEGAAIAAFCVGATSVYLATKRSYVREVHALSKAALELTASGLLPDFTFSIAEGPDEYLFGEEKALLEVIEGRDPLPRLLPPWQVGLYATAPAGGWESEVSRIDQRADANPTAVNNVETLASVTHMLEKGIEWFRSLGTQQSPGTLIATLVGDVKRPGVHEVECGTPFQELITRCGGARRGSKLIAAFSGVSNALLTADRFDTRLTFEDFAAAGSGLGAAGFVVYDDETDMTAVAREMSRFLSVESCGQCPACKQGTLTITQRLAAIDEGVGSDDDLAVIQATLRSVTDANRCSIGLEEQVLVGSIFTAFPEHITARLEATMTRGSRIHVPLIKDIDANGTVSFDERHSRKRPDWTFEP